jgi:hypothetical protein
MEKERLRKIFRKTDGFCHICHRKLIFANRGILGANGAWHIEHSKAKAYGGSDHLNNLFPACISCNIEKGTLNTKTIRLRYGVSRAPLSRNKKASVKGENTVGGAVVGGGIGLALGGPLGGIIGGMVGGIIGNSNSPKK